MDPVMFGDFVSAVVEIERRDAGRIGTIYSLLHNGLLRGKDGDWKTPEDFFPGLGNDNGDDEPMSVEDKIRLVFGDPDGCR